MIHRVQGSDIKRPHIQYFKIIEYSMQFSRGRPRAINSTPWWSQECFQINNCGFAYVHKQATRLLVPSCFLLPGTRHRRCHCHKKNMDSECNDEAGMDERAGYSNEFQKDLRWNTVPSEINNSSPIYFSGVNISALFSVPSGRLSADQSNHLFFLGT